MGKPIVTLGDSNLMKKLINTQPASTVKAMHHTANVAIIHAVKDHYDHEMLVLDAQRTKCFDAVDKQQEESKASCLVTYGVGLSLNSTDLDSFSGAYNTCIDSAISAHNASITACNYDFGNATVALGENMTAVHTAHLFDVN